MSQSSIFIRHLTVVDCAIVMPDGRIAGNSFHPSFVISGPVTSDEQVVIDFSKCKKRIKAIIDDYDNGFDHKLWVIDGYSNINTFTELDGYIKLSSDSVYLKAPKHTVKQFASNGEISIVRIAEQAFAKEVTEILQTEFPGVVVSCQNNQVVFASDNYVRFRYAHFLPASSSDPCKRCWHGHGSFIESDCSRQTLEEIGDSMKDVLFVNTKYLTESSTPANIELHVVNALGDKYYAEVSSAHQIIYMDKDTTIENIAEYVAKTYGDKIRKTGGSYVAVSEGLSKGAIVNV
jgi:6-pyruvoyl-tetrahydropterin synthase